MEKVYLLNSAVMPQDGDYRRVTLSQEEFKYELKKAHIIDSSVSYDDVITVIKKVTGVTVSKAEMKGGRRKITRITEDNAVILVVTLNHRITAERKGVYRTDDPTNYTFSKVYYKSVEKVESFSDLKHAKVGQRIKFCKATVSGTVSGKNHTLTKCSMYKSVQENLLKFGLESDTEYEFFAKYIGILAYKNDPFEIDEARKIEGIIQEIQYFESAWSLPYAKVIVNSEEFTISYL